MGAIRISDVGTCDRWVAGQPCISILGIGIRWFAVLSLAMGRKLVVQGEGISFLGNFPELPVLFCHRLY